MCQQYSSTYPCGHTKTRWELCKKAKAANLLRIGKAETPCQASGGGGGAKKSEPADLNETCGSTCLTKPYKCNKCDSTRAQTAWACADCHGLRDGAVLTWAPCQCPRHACPAKVLGAYFCRGCLDACVPRGSTLAWACCCGSMNRTYAGDMECGKCLHVRCGKCRALS
ncbi:hypothetical protein SAMD00023353_2000770 [Rosellinia necatrix]|uniref:Uncharacterized protein n=1 Tax=Rosellinia necatrix TaxID=77044 RepID=A0A1S8A7I8_ROSNE|nr:hypothetical protein SAMD00023353_2000770 [Rosellinia necatrix]